MSQSNQVAVAGPSALTEQSRPIRNGQHNIPRFLLKLYEIINDPTNEELIKWSESGDSFYIYHQERFAKEVLGKWFKHQNFSSFVRQLNLYGFRKITALQQGLLRMENDVETTQFAHPYFHRGQPDLLALIQRKRHPVTHTQPEGGIAGLLPPTSDDKTQGQAVDVRSIVDGIQAIRRQQQVIAADLSALKQSNDALWKEAIEARQRHAKHEDTINRILKFLAGLFGRVASGHDREQLHSEDQPQSRRPMLMIGDGRPNDSEGADYLTAGDFDLHSDTGSRAQSPFTVASDRFATVETPGASNASIASPMNTPPAVDRSVRSPLKGTQELPGWQSRDSHVRTSPNTVPPTTSAVSTASTKQQSQNPDAAWQATFQQMLNSPAQFQRIVQAFSNSQPPPNVGLGPSLGQPYAAPDVYNSLQPPLYNGALPAPIPPQQQQLTYPTAPTQSLQQPSPSLVGPAASAGNPTESALLDNAARMQKMYRDTSEINADIDVLQTNINTLIRDMGFDPHNISFPPVPGATDGASSAPPGDEGDFPFDAWLNQFSGSGGASNDSAAAGVNLPDLTYPGSPSRASTNLTATGRDQHGDNFSSLLDIPGFDASIGATSAPSGVGASSPGGQKRKLEVVEIPDADARGEASSNKKKR